MDDSGNYSCEARNRLGDVARSTVMIIVGRKLLLMQCPSLTNKRHSLFNEIAPFSFPAIFLRNCKSELKRWVLWLFTSSSTNLYRPE